MQAVAHLRYVRISPRKVQVVLDLIRNKPVAVALAILEHTPKAASEPLEKLLRSAMANAENNNQMDTEKLVVAKCFVTPGPTLKRIRPRAHGRVFPIMKRTSHVTIAVDDGEEKE